MLSFQRQQTFLYRKPAGKTCKLSVCSDYPMARNDYRKRIFVAGKTYGSSRFRISYCGRNFAIGFCFPERNFFKFVPDGFLKIRSGKFIFKLKKLSFTSSDSIWNKI